MTFSYAKPCRWCIWYTDDRIKDDEPQKQIFFKAKTLHEWMDKHPEKTITKMLTLYEYPKC